MARPKKTKVLQTIKYERIPQKNLLLMSVLFTKVLLIFPPVKWAIKKYLRNCSDIDFVPGFRFLYGNIYAKNCFLCDTFFADYAPIYIGENTKFSFDNLILTSFHDKDDFSKVHAKPVHIGKNVWITSRCIILGGVTIGDNSIVAAGSVVTKNVPPNTVVGGNPAKVIKHL